MRRHIGIFLLASLALLGCKDRGTTPGNTAEGSEQEKAGPKVEYYTCSMHPFIRQDGPGNCPICGMKLVPVYAQPVGAVRERPLQGSHDHNAESQAMPPSDRGPVVLDDTKRQLIGVRTEAVAKHPITREIDAAGRVAYDPDLLVAQSDYLVAARSGGGELGGLQGGLAQAAKRRLLLLGMSEAQIAQLRRRGKPDFNLLVPEAGQKVLVYASVFESDLPWIEAGMPLSAEAPGTGTVYTTNLESVDPTLNPATRTATLRFSLANPEGKLKPDMYLKVRLKSEGEPVLAIPSEAVVDTGLRQLAYLEVAPGRYEARELKLGRRGTAFVEVLKGLQENDRIVVNGNFLIDSESRLRGGGGGEGHQH
ncbi:MAG: efflux RND transporter periplasmic adaptor subunit [Deltaproteobacteria bacterium]|nr:efflux RND transporter periplasmic adaptor subunit [Deltaproteobacteria bacterium]